MIEQSHAMEVIVEACPSFRERWHAHLADWGNDVLYVVAGELALHLLALYQTGRASSFPLVAHAVERLCKEGSPWVKEFAVVGVLESIQNCWGNRGEDAEQFGVHLLPESRLAWDALNAAWSANTAGSGACG
jgi:hypothetical protein